VAAVLPFRISAPGEAIFFLVHPFFDIVAEDLLTELYGVLSIEPSPPIPATYKRG
jgi:hypothetical protein